MNGAVQAYTRPYFAEEYTTQGRGARADVLQANLSYSRFWNGTSLVIRAGQMTSAFGSFLLRYDPGANPLFGVPSAYGYYYKPVSSLGLMGAQADVTVGPLDLRAQFTNSSPGNRRSIFDREQYGNWAGGIGYTISQGFRIGASAYRGPYLHRQFRFYRPADGRPKDVPGSALGLDAQWGKGPWNAWGEWQHFQLNYIGRAHSVQNTGYGELRRVLNARWFAAARIDYLRANKFPGWETYEFAVGFRANRHQVIRFDYLRRHQLASGGIWDSIGVIELVTTLHPLSIAFTGR